MGKARNIADLLNSSGKIDSADIDSSAQFYQFKNRIINGAMMIDQRNAGASVTANNSGVYGVDRFLTEAYGGGSLSSQRSTTAPAGFINSLLLTVTGTDTSLSTSDDYEFNQKIEGFNCSDLGFGTANASTITMSFWVRSSVIGTYSVGFQNSSASRSYVATYTINAANTWEQKTITVAGDTGGSGSWETGNSTGLFIRWCLATGTNRIASAANTWESANRIAISSTANPIMGTSGATFYITGVQLEKGSTATSFDYRPYGTELALCQRYAIKYLGSGAYEKVPAVGMCLSSTQFTASIGVPVAMRASPSLSYSNIVLGTTSSAISVTSVVVDHTSTLAPSFNFNVSSGLTTGQPAFLQANATTSAFVILSAEL